MKDHTTTGSSCIIILLFKAIRLVNIALITKVLAPSRWLGMGFLNHQQYLSWGRGGGRWHCGIGEGLGWVKVEVSSLLASLQTGVGGVLLLTSVPW